MKKLFCCAIAWGFATGAFAQIIWDNGGNAGFSMSSQRDTQYPWQSQVADDFRLPAGPGGEPQWLITEVNWAGGYWNGQPTPDDFNVFIYNDAGGLPTMPPSGSAIHRYTATFPEVNETTDPGGNGFNYSLVLPAPFLVNANTTYWIGIQSDVNFPPQWGWNDSIFIQLSEAAFVSYEFGFPSWVPGRAAFGTPRDASYSLAGRPVPEPATGSYPPGDLNCDGLFNGGDIDPFFLALGDPAAYLAAFPDCNINNGDMNCDQAVNGADIDRFFACLAGNNCPDCNANGVPDDCDGIGPLAIVTQPQSTLACVGDTVTLTVETSSSPLTVQWRKNGVAIAGATSTRLRISPVQLADAGDYDAIVGDACVSLTSEIATLTVHTAPAINTHPRSQTVCFGGPLVLSVGASGPALTYQWRKNGTDIPGATDPLYIVPVVSETDAGLYDVRVINSCGGPVWSDLASVTIQTTILTHPAGQTVCENDPVFFSVGASGASLTYQWRKDAVNISGATQNFFIINAAQLSDAGVYDVEVTSTTCTQTSDPAPLVVQKCP